MPYADNQYLFTSESVAEGHPDKVCDRISDEILDLFLRKDPHARVAVEALATTQRVVLAGEVRSTVDVSQEEIIKTTRKAVKDIGYEQEGFHWKTMKVQSYIHAQSVDIAQGVDKAFDAQKGVGAGDQGIMFGYATNETDNLMPAPLAFSHDILRRLAIFRHQNPQAGLGPDAKSQVTLRYENSKPVAATSVVVSTQHKQGVSQDDVRKLVVEHIEASLPAGWMPNPKDIYVNPTGRFVIGGPDGDTGLTGRKIIVDTYGGSAPHGGGAFSGKDATKVDRSAAYMARYLAKNIVAAKLAMFCVIQVSYAIGVAQPLSVYVHTGGTSKVPEIELVHMIRELVDLTPQGILNHLCLARPIYAPTSAYGHFGRIPSKQGHFSWEKTDLADKFRSYLNL